jgi:hypothetical protein
LYSLTAPQPPAPSAIRATARSNANRDPLRQAGIQAPRSRAEITAQREEKSREEETKLAAKAAADEEQRKQLRALMITQTEIPVEEPMFIDEVSGHGNENEPEVREAEMEEATIIDIGSSDVEDDDVPSPLFISTPSSDTESSGTPVQHQKHIRVSPPSIVRPLHPSAASQATSKVRCTAGSWSILLIRLYYRASGLPKRKRS